MEGKSKLFLDFLGQAMLARVGEFKAFAQHARAPL
jgi:hypothetical protein